MVPEAISIRRAHASEAAELTALAHRSKAHWGYSAGFIEACRAELTVDAETVDARPTFVLVDRGRTAAFYVLAPAADSGLELELFFVDPPRIGRGLGRRLIEHAKTQVLELGHTRLRVQSDPHAEPFYLAVGARRVGSEPSRSIEGRRLPVLEFDLA